MWQREFHIDEATWRRWQRPDGTICLPPEWTIRVHIENPTRREFPSAKCRLRIIRPYAEPDEIVKESEDGPVRAGETRDFVYPLSEYPLAPITFFQITFRMKQADGKRQEVADIQSTICLDHAPAPNRKR